MWVDTPDKPGYWLFVGKRTTRSRGFVNEVAEPCEVLDKKGFDGLVVSYIGSGMIWGIDKHEGKWYWLGEILNEQASLK